MKNKILNAIKNLLDKNTTCHYFKNCIKPRNCNYRFCVLTRIRQICDEVNQCENQ